ncbi:hypothetical protein [Bacillus thuringiensis]|uniref:hypothetical protein n=1 Tax=Bacillus thuringiensis TaxID=1428 RepID=UPI0021D64F0C|nr:hypothetical protein [Bacillus thuringiensis]MCU7667452.1 hypothetical protein [Bacillus thuringiensis]
MSDTNKIAGENIRVFIESRELKNSWIMERAGIGENDFYDMLNGKGNIDVHVTKLNNYFKINDPMYFYKTDFDYAKPKNLLNRKETFLKQVTVGENSNELNEGLEVFFDFVELIDVLKAVQE